MITLDISRSSLMGLDDERKKRIREKAAAGELELNVTEDIDDMGILDVAGKNAGDTKKVEQIQAPDTLSQEQYGELMKEDNTATIPTVATGGIFSAEDPKWKAAEEKKGDLVTMPTSAKGTEEIADGVVKQEAPIRPEVDSETEWKRGLLAKTNDIKTNVSNAKRVFEQGGYKLIGVKPNEPGAATQSNVYKLEKDGNEYIIDENSFDSAMWDLGGDPASNAIALGTAGIGTAIGLGGIGNMIDQAISKAMSGEELSAEQRAVEVLKEAALFGAGEAIVKSAPLLIKGAKGMLEAPAWAKENIYGYIANGNMPGAKSFAKDILGVDDAYMDEAVKSMQTWQKEAYSKGADADKKRLKDVLFADNKLESAAEYVKEAIDSSKNMTDQERLLATVMQHPEGERYLLPALDGNIDAATQAMRSIDARVQQARELLDSASGTEIKQAVQEYEGRVADQYKDMRNTFTEAFKKSNYRFNLDDLKIEDKIKSMGSYVGDDYIQKQFEAMSSAVKAKIEGARSGAGVTRNIDDLLDLWQRVNKFYGKYGKQLDKPDVEVFENIKKGIGDEVERALEKHTTPEISRDLLRYFDDARDAYSEMYRVSETNLYKGLMGEGKSAKDRVDALIKHAQDDEGELQRLLNKLTPEAADRAESAIIDSVLSKHTAGETGKLQALNTAAALDDLEALKPFLKSDASQQGIKLLEEMHQKFKHDFSLYQAAKGETVKQPEGGISPSPIGRMRTAAGSAIFRYMKSMIPFSRDAKALALQRHIGKALEKSRAPVDMAKRVYSSMALLPNQRSELKELIKINNKAMAAKNKAAADAALQELRDFEAKMEAKRINDVLSVKEFKKPDIYEIRAIEKLGQDDAKATLARSIRAIQEGKAGSADIKRYLEAKEYIEPERLAKAIEKERLFSLDQKYRFVGEEEIGKIDKLRGYLMSDATLKYGNEFNPQQVKALIYDLKTNGKPRDLKYDKLYDDVMGMYDALAPRIDEAYGKVSVQSLTRVPASSEDAASSVTRHQGHQAERLPLRGVPSAQGYGSQSAQTYDSIAKANEKFKDSVVRDESGDLKVLYHGTNSDFDTFNVNKAANGNFGHGFYLAEDVETVNAHFAKGYGANIMPVMANIENPFDIDDLAKAMPVYEAFAKEFGMKMPKEAKNPLAVYKLITNGSKGKEQFRNFLEYLGYDGIVGKTPGAGRQYVAFYPNQIKSIHNRGTFDPKNPNILMANHHIGSGLVAGSGNAIVYDEEGNIVGFDTDGFVSGFLAGAIGSKAGAAALNRVNPKLYNKILGVSKEFPNMATSNPKLLAQIYKTAPSAKGQALTFAGEKAIKADVAKLDDAMKLADSGAKESDIWRSTGWFKGDDGKWRFEVDDSGAKMLSKAELDALAKDDPYEMIEIPLSQIFKHDKLFEQYPKLKDINVNWEYSKAKGLEKPENVYHGASFNHKENLIIIGNGLNDKDIKSSILHEVQHAVQGIEDFARGGNPQSIKGISKYQEDKLRDELSEISSEQLSRKLGNEPKSIWVYDNNMVLKTDKELESYEADIIQELKNTKHNNYERLHGEAEARLTQKRADAGYKNYPYDDLDVPRDELIIRDGEGVAEMSIETEARYINPKNGNLTSQFKKDAMPMPKALSKKEFAKQYGDTYGWTSVETPIGKIKFNVNSAYKHMESDNTYFADRVNFSGAFDKALTDPLMIVKNPLKDGQTEYYLPLKNETDGILHFINIAKDKNGELKQITFFDVSEDEAKRIIKSQGSNMLYFKYSTATKQMLDTGDAVQIPKKSPSTNESITKEYKDSQGVTSILPASSASKEKINER
ncbi:MAG TPA: hypothetical protein CFH81_08885 [Sulfurovum sp. UBA12169]|nr:MAG TPA: hypothetical protein CFH81_08885 [Sulfurovum sp. UBA12169]